MASRPKAANTAHQRASSRDQRRGRTGTHEGSAAAAHTRACSPFQATHPSGIAAAGSGDGSRTFVVMTSQGEKGEREGGGRCPSGQPVASRIARSTAPATAGAITSYAQRTVTSP